MFRTFLLYREWNIVMLASGQTSGAEWALATGQAFVGSAPASVLASQRASGSESALVQASPACVLVGRSSESRQDADDGDRRWPARSSISRSWARKAALRFGVGTIFRCSGSEFGRGAPLTPGPRRSALQPNSEPENWNIAQIKALNALFQAKHRLMDLRAGRGRSPSSASYGDPHELPTRTHPIPASDPERARVFGLA